MDRLPYEISFAALAFGVLLFFGISVYFGSGHAKTKRPGPQQGFSLQLASQKFVLTTRVQRQIKVSSESEFTAGWWTSSKIFDLERRAIFSKVSMSLSPIQAQFHLMHGRRGSISPTETNSLKRAITANFRSRDSNSS
jgi:hypothetical protein